MFIISLLAKCLYYIITTEEERAHDRYMAYMKKTLKWYRTNNNELIDSIKREYEH